MQPLVSIVTPCYNHEQYLDDYFRGLLSQTYRNIELIIIDDCSQDSSWDKICSYEPLLREIFPRVICERNATNQGAFKVVTEAQKRATGEFRSILESDDYYLPTKVEENVNYLQAHPEIGVVHSKADYIHFDGTPYLGWVPTREVVPTGQVFEQLLVDNFVLTCTFCCRSNLFLQYVDGDKYAQRGYLMGDYPACLDLAKHTQFGYIPKPLARYRILEESASHPRDPHKKFLFGRSYSQIKLDYIRDYRVCNEIKKEIVRDVSLHFLDHAYGHYYQQRYNTAARALLFSIQVRPALLGNGRAIRLIAKLLLGERGTEGVRWLKCQIFQGGTGR